MATSMLLRYGKLFGATVGATPHPYRNFILGLCLTFQERSPDWRQHTLLYIDNAAFHHSDYIVDKFEAFQVPLMYSGK